MADILHLLGGLRSKSARPLALQMAGHKHPELRCRAAYVLGWTCHQKDLATLAKLLEDDDPRVRETTASAHSQVFHRLPRARDRLVRNLKTVLEREEDLSVLAQVVLELQTLLKKRFGLRWDFDEGEVVGDVQKAVAKARKAVLGG